MDKTHTHTPSLNRSISLPVLILYGMGTMIGGGIYALLGKVAGTSGVMMPLAFIISTLVAYLTSLSYAGLSSQFPVSAGEAKYVDVAFNSKLLSQIVGLLVVFTGLASISTLVKAGAGFLFDLTDGVLHESLGVLAVVLLLAFVCYRDIGLSTKIIAAITLIELGGLIAVIGLNYDLFGSFPTYVETVSEEIFTQEFPVLSAAILSGAFLAFYAFIGFEDMVNVAEEVKDAEKALPKAIIGAFIVTSILYLLIAYVAITKVDLEVLENAKTPLAVLVSGTDEGGIVISAFTMGIISLIAGLNGALVQMIMVSRVLYGLSREGKAPAFLSDLHSHHKTPVKSVLLTAWIALVCGLLLPVQSLASYASGVILLVFVFVNLSAFMIGFRHKQIKTSVIAGLAALCCLALLYGVFV